MNAIVQNPYTSGFDHNYLPQQTMVIVIAAGWFGGISPSLMVCHLETNNVLFPQISNNTLHEAIASCFPVFSPISTIQVASSKRTVRGLLPVLVEIITAWLAAKIAGRLAANPNRSYFGLRRCCRILNRLCEHLTARFDHMFSIAHGLLFAAALLFQCWVLVSSPKADPTFKLVVTTITTVVLTFAVPYAEFRVGKPIVQFCTWIQPLLDSILTIDPQSTNIVTGSQKIFNNLVDELITISQRYVSGQIWNFGVSKLILFGADKIYIRIWLYQVEAVLGTPKWLTQRARSLECQSDAERLNYRRMGARVLRRSFFLVEEVVVPFFPRPHILYSKVGKPFLSNIWVETSLKVLRDKDVGIAATWYSI
ncbi:hypothetical protein V8F20_012557 [Naviculisporaceae sp. PSN 640]